jgi:SAM-dependent methyltransferase
VAELAPEYERLVPSVEDEHWWFRGRRRILREVVSSLSLPKPARVLDAGCGTGRNLEELKPLGNVTGLELSSANAELARARGIGEIVEGSVDAAPFSDSTFDLITCLDVLEHVEDDRGALRELRRLLRPGGSVVVTVPAYPRLWGPHDVINEHRRRYTKAALLAAAEDAGLTPVQVTHFNAVLLPIAVAYRLLRRDHAARREESELERTPSWLNPVLERPFRAEARAIGRGWALPFGLSILAVLVPAEER